MPCPLSSEELESVSAQVSKAKHAQRNLLDFAPVRQLACCQSVRKLVAAVLGPDCFAVRGILFNKTPDSNWKVVWHQDRTIAVRERIDVPQFGPWSVKAGVPSVQPPTSIMAKMLAMRLHLDENDESNGPLRVIPGSHRAGCLAAEQILAWKERPTVTCTVPRGGVILMRPLLLHASSACSQPKQRRVVHLEFACEKLPGGLEWHDRV